MSPVGDNAVHLKRVNRSINSDERLQIYGRSVSKFYIIHLIIIVLIGCALLLRMLYNPVTDDNRSEFLYHSSAIVNQRPFVELRGLRSSRRLNSPDSSRKEISGTSFFNDISPPVNLTHHHIHHHFHHHFDNDNNVGNERPSNDHREDTIDVVAIVCGNLHSSMVSAFLVSIKNACKPSAHRIRVTIFGDDLAYHYMYGLSNAYDKIYEDLNFQVVNISRYRTDSLENAVDPRFKCSMYKLNFAKMMPWEVKRVIYLDVDIIVYEDLAHLWALADVPTPISGISTSTPNQKSSDNINSKSTVFHLTSANFNFHSQFGGKHYYPSLGLNSGVMIMNIDAMRRENLTAEYFAAADDEPPLFGEQGYIENWAFYHQDRVELLPCKWNMVDTSPNAPCHYNNSEGLFHGPNGAFFHKLWFIPYGSNEEFKILNSFANATHHLAWLNAW